MMNWNLYILIFLSATSLVFTIITLMKISVLTKNTEQVLIFVQRKLFEHQSQLSDASLEKRLEGLQKARFSIDMTKPPTLNRIKGHERKI